MRTIEPVRLMKKIILHELDRLPGTNNKPNHNDENNRKRLHGWIIDLAYIEQFGTIGDHNSEISTWYKGEPLDSQRDIDILLDEFTEYEEILRLATQLRM